MTSGERESVAPAVTGRVLRLDEPLCFLVVDPESGAITDPDHPQLGASVAGAVLAMPGSRGGAVTPSQLCETMRNGVGPAAIVLPRPDPAIVIGCAIASRLYGLQVPVVVVGTADYEALTTGDHVTVGPGGLLATDPVT